MCTEKHYLNSIYVLFADGNQDEKNICGWIIGANDSRRRQELLRTVWTGECYFCFIFNDICYTFLRRDRKLLIRNSSVQFVIANS